MSAHPHKFSAFAKLLLQSLTILFLFIACKKDAETPPLPEPEYLTEEVFIKNLSSSEVKNVAGQIEGFPSLFLGLFQFNLKVYKITYKTKNYDGSDILASGALLIPQTGNSLPLLSQHHGTLIDPVDELAAPSYFGQGSEAFVPGILFASIGYVVAVPDYIGYGASKDLTHPYEHGASLATTCRDMMRAAREFCARNQVNLNGKVFLTGYSEGGYATMATFKLLQEQHNPEFNVTACAAGAGAYDKTAFGNYIVNANENLNFLPTYLWVLDTYNRIYNINRPYNQLFNEPYATNISQNGIFVDGLPLNPQVLFKSDFLNGIKNGTDTQFINAFSQNNNFDWKPTAPLRLIHGTKDDYVPFFNSQSAFDAMQARGATQVSLSPIQDGNHFTSAVPFYLGTYQFFAGF
jgi:fermentation-respiration switch protein FrsA (DUF1100 family)